MSGRKVGAKDACRVVGREKKKKKEINSVLGGIFQCLGDYIGI